MCVIFLSYNQNSEFPLILAANRDEYYERPTAAADYWEDFPEIYAGRDLVSKGTWLGMGENGRFSAVTNFRDPSYPKGSRSRGDLVADFLKTEESAAAYMDRISSEAGQFSGFNLLVGEVNKNSSDVYYFSNRENVVRKLASGSYGLSNHLLDTSWPKVANGKRRFEELTSENAGREAYFELLSDKTQAKDEELPDTGVGIEIERVLSPIFIETPIYGTRCSTIVTIDGKFQASLEERTVV